jgi:excisionase family DNA binding protein
MEFSENMRAKEAHKYLGVGLSTLWAYVAQSKIKAYKISDRVTIFKKSELDAFINGGAK